ncbi:MAG TPA: hypothetical protein VGZ91_05775 [Candidatus Sulfotelmatobacter sp.]|jgi:hypothetical protein|nr:hypothetical protein [Candidatus Sulfotelmatobacter sp.]
MAKAAENDAATTMVGQCRSSDIDRNDIIMGLTDMPSARPRPEVKGVEA